jgi:NAD(P)-dependent dehydrogenase (short-subunit alcohol dehydrogenase family)
MRLNDLVTVVTGAAGGLGSAITHRFLREGAAVVAVDIHHERLDRLVTDFPDARLTGFEADVASGSDCARMRAFIEDRFGRVDVLVNNAGIYPSQSFEDITHEEWRRVIGINLDSAFLMTSAMLPLMKRLGRGRIINISSGTVLLGTPTYTHYAATKAGLIGFTRSLASELGPSGITVNAVAPGLTLTDTVAATVSAELLERRRLQRAVRRHQMPDDIVGTILFLASADSDFVTGQLINVDGGTAMH